MHKFQYLHKLMSIRCKSEYKMHSISKAIDTMYIVIVLSVTLEILVNAETVCNNGEDLAARQLVTFKDNNSDSMAVMTTRFSSPVEYKDATYTLNTRLLNNENFLFTITHFSRERIPERVVHAKGGGAFGYFITTNDISPYCKAKLFDGVGKKTPVAIRFSTVRGNIGSPDLLRDARGFAIKFYTEEGNFDIVGLSNPVFQIRDPLYFPTFAHAVKRNPATNLFDANSFWDFLTLRSEALHMFMYVFSGRGITKDFSHTPGFSIHTYEVVNEYDEKYFMRFHFLPDAGIKTLTTKEAMELAGKDADAFIRKLYNDIAIGNYPTWTLYIQLLTTEDVKNVNYDIFDVTSIIPENDFPLIPVGSVVLDRNPENYFADIEQLAFCPGNLVPGILGAPDKLFQARRLSYIDAQYYRLGANFHKIPVNCPLHPEQSYTRDGRAPLRRNHGGVPNYYQNSFHGSVPYHDKNLPELSVIYEHEPDNFGQASELYEKMDENEKDMLVNTIAGNLGKATGFLQERALHLYSLINHDLSNRLSQQIFNGSLDCNEGPQPLI